MNPATHPSQVKWKATSTAAAIEYIFNNNTPTVSQQRASSKNNNNSKPIRGRVDYNFFNYCSQCDLKLSKYILRCTCCNQKVRTKLWHRSKILQFKRI
jgi:hypothetical protein